MSQSSRTGLILVVILFGTIGIGVMLLQAGLVTVQIAEVSDFTSEVSDFNSDFSDTLETFVDQHIDAGYEDPGLRADDPLLKERRILLGQDVNARAAKDVVARLLYLDSVDKERPIDLYISTQGGWIDNAFTIIDVMRLIDAPVNTWAIGGCYSSGALILTAGTGRRIATDNAIIMIHTNLNDSSARYSFDRLARKRYENVWRTTAELPGDWYPMTSDRSYYLTAEEARTFKVVDEVVGTWPAGGTDR